MNVIRPRNIKQILEDDEISLIQLIQVFWRKRKVALYSTGVALFAGLIVAFTSHVEYTSTAKLLTEDGGVSETNRGLAGLAGLAGITIENASGSDIPDYASIAQSQPFLLDLIKEKIYSVEAKEEVTIEKYLTDPARQSFPAKVFNVIKSGSIFSKSHSSGQITAEQKNRLAKQAQIAILSPSELSAMNSLRSLITVTPEGRFLSLEVKMPEASMSAELNQLVKNKLVDYVVEYKTVRRKRNLEFLEERTAEAKSNYTNAQMGLAGYQDRNIGLVVQTGRARETQLQAQYNLYFTLYSSLASQLEQARIKLKEDTPVFTDFEPVTIPQSPSGPNRIKIILIALVLGVVIGGMLIVAMLFKEAYFISYNNELKNIFES